MGFDGIFMATSIRWREFSSCNLVVAGEKVDFSSFDVAAREMVKEKVMSLDVGILINNVGPFISIHQVPWLQDWSFALLFIPSLRMKLPHCSRNDWKGWSISSRRLRYFHELKDQEVADIMEVNMCSMTWMNLGLDRHYDGLILPEISVLDLKFWDLFFLPSYCSSFCFNVAPPWRAQDYFGRQFFISFIPCNHTIADTVLVPQSPHGYEDQCNPVTILPNKKYVDERMIPFRSRIVLGDESGPGMLSRRRGAIINTSSGSARATSPLLAEYSAAKAYVERQGLKWFSFLDVYSHWNLRYPPKLPAQHTKRLLTTIFP